MLTMDKDQRLTMDKGIPVPPKKWGKKRNEEIHSLLENMEIGDSFALEVDATNDKGKKYVQFFIPFRTTGYKKYKYKFAERLSDDGKKIRIWRVE